MSTELIVIEALSLVIISAILLERKSVRFSDSMLNITTMYPVLISFLVYLVISILNHLHMSLLIRYPEPAVKLITILHTLSFPQFILSWMTHLERKTLTRRRFRMLLIVELALLAVFTILTIVDLGTGRLFMFSDAHQLEGGSGITIMLLLCGAYTVTGIMTVLHAWRSIDRYSRMVYLLSSGFILFSLVLFHLFRQPYMFALSNTFMLLFSYLYFQRRELEIDVLTRIPNFPAFIDHVEHVLRAKIESTMIVVDIENFWLINNRYGNSVGDAVLKVFSAYLVGFEPRAKVFRIAGNRFALSFPLMTHNQVVGSVKAIKSRCVQGWSLGMLGISFYVNIAIAELPRHANTRDKLLEILDFMLTEIKARRRQSVIIYNKRLTQLQLRRLDVLTALRGAIADESRIIVHYQPIHDVLSGRIHAAEALMRLQDPQMGMISPNEFIPAAEQTALISKLTEVIVRKVIRFLHDHANLLASLSHISINISADDLSSNEASRRLLDILSGPDADPSRIGFEVTESMLLSSKQSVLERWEAFSSKGVKFLLDDFGTGYANLESLTSLPFDVVKIDRSVISNSRNNYELITVISLMLERLGKQIVAEGVETREQLEFAQAAGVRYVQGYYFSKPVPEDQLLDMLRYDRAKQ